MEIAILGAGHIGGTLAKQWAKAGHTIHFGLRDPQKPETQSLLNSIGEKASASSIPDAINAGEVVFFAIPGTAMDAAITANAKALDGKIVIDAANKIGAAISHSMPTFASQTPKASVYRAFNSYGWENFENPKFGDVRADMFFCGPDGAPRAIVEKLIQEVGLSPVYLGGPEQVELVDSILKVWITLVRGQKMSRRLAFKLLKG